MVNECSCDSSNTFPKTAVCPANGKRYRQVQSKTMLHQLKQPWQRLIKQQGYYFCDSDECNVVYFGEDKSVYTIDDLRQQVGQKLKSLKRTMCYCFGVTYQDLCINDENYNSIKEFIVQQTRSGSCACATKNPSGKCCLKEIDKAES